MSYPLYNITYPDCDCTQSKILVPITDYEQCKAEKKGIELMEEQLKDKKLSKEDKERIKNEIKSIKIKWSVLDEPYFVEGSPMYDAIETGIIFIEEQYGNHGKYPAIIKLKE